MQLFSRTQAPPANAMEYRALQERRSELSNQLQQVQTRRGQLADQLRAATTEAKVLGVQPDAQATGTLRTQIAALDERLAKIQAQVDATSDQIAAASPEVLAELRSEHQAMVMVPPPGNPLQERIANDIIPLAGMFSVFFVLPLAISLSRFIWKRSSAPAPRAAALDAQAQQRLEQLQQSMDAIALEVERISEGQRYVAKLFSEKEHRAIGA